MKRSLLLLLVLIVVGFAIWYAYKEYNRTNQSLNEAKAAATVSAATLLNAFEQDSAKAAKQYNDKIIIISGPVKKIAGGSNPVVIMLGDAGQLSSVQCSMDSTNVNRYNALKTGMTATLKGQVAGFRTDPLFGTDVILDRCVVASNP